MRTPRQIIDESDYDETRQAVSPDTFDAVSLDNLVAEFQSTVSSEVKVYRVQPNTKLAYIYSCHPSEFRFDDLRDVYGGGKFRVFVFASESGKKSLKASPQFDIESPKLKHTTEQNTDSLQAIQLMVSAMQKGFDGLAQLIVSNAQKHIVDPEVTEMRMLEKMQMMKNIFGSPAPVSEVGGIDRALDMLQRGIDLGSKFAEVRGEATSTDVLLETVKSFGPAIIAGMGTQNAVQEQMPKKPPPIPVLQHSQQVSQSAMKQPISQVFSQPVVQPVLQAVPVANQNIEANKPIGDNMGFLADTRLKMGMRLLLDAAKRNASPELYAGLILDQMTDDDIDSFLSQDSPLEYVAKFEPEILGYRDWFGRVLVEFKGLLTFDDEPDISGTIDAAVSSKDGA